MRILTAVLLVSSVIPAGCASMADATSKLGNLGVVEQEKSVFDGSTIVRMSPAFLYREGALLGLPFKLGAQWSSKSPDHVALVLSYQSSTSAGGPIYVSFNSLSINIDGDISNHRVSGPTSTDNSSYNTVSRTIYTSSQNSVVIPIAQLRKMLSASDCRLRVETSRGNDDVQFSIERIPGGQATAIIPLREFVAKVDSLKP